MDTNDNKQSQPRQDGTAPHSKGFLWTGTSQRRLNIKRIEEKAERLKRAEIKEKEWLKKHQTQQIF